jgi:O-methyltransferase involved in polyketide biosynthesis
VDNDPVVLVHARALLTSDPAGVTSYIDADARDPDTMVAAAGATLDFGEPVAIIMVDLLNFIDDEAAASVVPRLTAAVAPGSYLAIMHPASDLDPALPEAGRRWNELAAQPVWLRSREDVNRFLAGLGELWQRSGGNPFFVRELTRLLAAQGSWQQPPRSRPASRKRCGGGWPGCPRTASGCWSGRPSRDATSTSTCWPIAPRPVRSPPC